MIISGLSSWEPTRGSLLQAWCGFFETSKPTPSDTLLPTRPHLLIIPKLLVHYMNLWRPFSFKLPCAPSVKNQATGTVVQFRPKLLPRASISGSMVLLQLGSVMVPIAYVSTGGHWNHAVLSWPLLLWALAGYCLPLLLGKIAPPLTIGLQLTWEAH